MRTKDTGTLRYDTYFNDDESECVILEFYRDSQAAMEQLSTSANYRRRSSRSYPWFTANSSGSRTKTSEPGWQAARSHNSSRPTSPTVRPNRSGSSGVFPSLPRRRPRCA